MKSMKSNLYAGALYGEGLRSVGMVERARKLDGKISSETRLYLSSLSANAREFARAVRGQEHRKSSSDKLCILRYRLALVDLVCSPG